MLQYILRRVLWMIPTFLVTSLVAFAIIQLPPGDYATSYLANLAAQGTQAGKDVEESLRQAYGLGESLPMQYWKWMQGILTRGDFGIAFELIRPVSSMLWDKVWLTI